MIPNSLCKTQPNSRSGPRHMGLVPSLTPHGGALASSQNKIKSPIKVSNGNLKTFKIPNPTARTNYVSDPLTALYEHADKPTPLYTSGVNSNHTQLRETQLKSSIDKDLNLVGKESDPTVFERIPEDRIQQFQSWRSKDYERDQILVNQRFPELSQARETFLGKEQPRSPLKKQHVNELVKFSDVVYKLAQDEEPHPARQSLAFQQSAQANQKRKRSLELNKSPYSKYYELAAKKTMTHSTKDRYIVRSKQHTKSQVNRFMPVNPTAARNALTAPFECPMEDYDDSGVAYAVRHKYQDINLHGDKKFLSTSPITQDQYRASPRATLNMGNTYSKFLTAANSSQTSSFNGAFNASASKTQSPNGQGSWLPQDQTAVSGFMMNQTANASKFSGVDSTSTNPRQQVLENFREISRIMTQNFLTHKKLDKKYANSSLPKADQAKKDQEGVAQSRMQIILKKMGSPANFQAPAQFLPGQSQWSASGEDLRGGRDRVSKMTSNMRNTSLTPRGNFVADRTTSTVCNNGGQQPISIQSGQRIQ